MSKLSEGERRLAAIMFTDMVGYTTLTQSNESLSIKLLERHNQLLRPFFSRFHGREVKAIGDSFLVEFGSALDALRCALELQSYLHDYNISSKDGWKIRLRIGIHLGDVIHRGGDVFGDAVNIASRIEPIAEPEGICITEQVYDQVHNKFELPLISLGEKPLKNVSAPIEVYKLVMPWDEEKLVPSTQYDKRRIAVLPFTNISPDPNDAYFADGMTEELIATMSKISGLKVIARTSINRYKGGEKGISEIAKELEVGTILEGSVRKVENNVRTTVQLIDSQTSEHLWAESYDRELRDILAIQSDISKTVAEALKVQLLSREKAVIEKKQTVNPEAYALYLKGRFHWNERTKENVSKAIKYFEQVVKIDPKFAPAYSGLADCYNVVSWEPNYSWMAPNIAGPLAKDFSIKALEIDDGLAEAHASLAVTLMNYFWDFGSAARELKRAAELGPNYAPAPHWHGNLLIYLGKYEEALSEERRAMVLDPYSRVINSNMAVILSALGRVEEAMELFGKLIELNPDFAVAHFWKSQVHAWISEYDEAIEEAKNALDLDRTPTMELNLAWVHGVAGKKDEAKRILDDVINQVTKVYVCPAWIALVEFAMGYPDEGFRWLKEGLAARGSSLLYFSGLPWFKDYRSDPRWKQIGEKLGLPQDS